MQLVHPGTQASMLPLPMDPATDLAALVAGANGSGNWFARLLRRKEPDRERRQEEEDDSFERRAQELI